MIIFLYLLRFILCVKTIIDYLLEFFPHLYILRILLKKGNDIRSLLCGFIFAALIIPHDQKQTRNFFGDDDRHKSTLMCERDFISLFCSDATLPTFNPHVVHFRFPSSL